VTERAVPFYCPYCGDEDLRPHDAEPGTYACGACQRSFALRLVALTGG
jgi:transcription elongation factor Elf1